MNSTLRCPQGHTWQRESSTDGADVACPICGAAAVADESSTVTVPPRAPEPATIAPSAAPTGATGRPTVPGYELLAELGRGGMGVVYQARHLQLERIVALKMILAGGHASADELERFRIEAQAIARLQHPHIVQVYEVGEYNGLPYFSLEFCSGGTLAQRLAGAPLTPGEAAALVETLARAMQEAHQKGIVHRDLKPANVLLADGGTPKITDFGLAKLLDEAGKTATGAVMGTPSYMAPEQTGGKSKELGPACDVYALGAILYECLTGRPPFQATTALDTMMQVVADEPVPPTKLQPKTPGDLETICLKCLRKEPTQRYTSTEILADDLLRWQRGEPIAARVASRPERLIKWARRRPERAVLCGLAILALGIGLGWAALQGWHVVQQKIFEREYQHSRAEADLGLGSRLCQVGQLDEGVLHLARGLRLAVTAQAGKLERNLRLELGRYAPRLPRLVTIRRNDEPFVPRHDFPEYSICLSRDGKRLVAAGPRWGARSCDVDSSPRLDPEPVEKSPVTKWVAISPDGSQVVDGLLLRDAMTGKPLRKFDGGGAMWRFAPDGKWLLSLGPAGLWDPVTGQAIGRPLVKDAQLPAAISPDSAWIAFRRGVNEVRLCDAATGQAREPVLSHPGVRALAFSPDSKLLATAGDDKLVRLWDVKTGKPSREPLPQRVQVRSLAFSPDSRRLLLGDNGVQLWDLDTGKPCWPEQPCRGGGPMLLSFGADGKTFWTLTETHICQFDATTGRLLGGVSHQCGEIQKPAPGGYAISADGHRLAVLGMRGEDWRIRDEHGKVGRGGGTRSAHVILVWELPNALPGADAEVQPLAGTAEQISLWVQAQTGRGLGDWEGQVRNWDLDLWLQCREEMAAAGGLAVP